MKSRRRSREIALQILYQHDLAAHSTGQAVPQGQDLVQMLRRHYEHFQVHEDIREFIGQLVAGTLTHLKELDPIIEAHASNWKVSRMSSVDRSLLRMTTYEMLYLDQSVPPTVIIDEAIEIAKQFGTAESPGFINGILDSIKKTRPDSA